MSPRSSRALLVAALVLALWPADPARAGSPAPCPDEGGVGYVCGVDDPEDLIRVPGTPWVLTTGLGHGDSERGGLFAVHVRTRVARKLAPDFSGRGKAAGSVCPGPPDRELFSAHGLTLNATRAGPRRRTVATVYVVNHGGRETIEVFRAVVSAKRVHLDWTGCIPMLEGLAANSVAALPGGDLVATVPVLNESELFNAGLGQPTGDVLRWSEATEWRSVPGAEISFPNGILVSRDGKRLYVAGYTEQAVVEVPLVDSEQPLRRVQTPFNPDNLRWSPSGEILVTGQDEEPAVVQLSCIESDQETCAIPTGVAQLDPESFAAVPLYAHPGNEAFGMGTASIVVGDELWIGSARAKRLLRAPSSALAAPLESDTPNGLPALRLSRRCVGGGRVRVAVTGDVGQVERVRFKPGTRDRQAPFARVLSPRAARKRARAVVTVLHGERMQVVLRSGARSCADR